MQAQTGERQDGAVEGRHLAIERQASAARHASVQRFALAAFSDECLQMVGMRWRWVAGFLQAGRLNLRVPGWGEVVDNPASVTDR